METIGPAMFERNSAGHYNSAIGTLFPRHHLLVTSPPVHLLQRAEFGPWFRRQTTAPGRPAPGDNQVQWESNESVDLIFAAGDVVLVRPEFDRLDLAFEADRQLQEEWQVPEHRIRFLFVSDRRIRQALRERGELWRMSAPPTERHQITAALQHAKVAIGEGTIYYYNPHSGTRFVTCAEFARLAGLDDAALARQLDEIGTHCRQVNRHGQPEIAFFGADPLQFGAPLFAGTCFAELEPAVVRARFAELRRLFAFATPEDLRADEPKSEPMRSRLFAALNREPHTEGEDGRFAVAGVEAWRRIRWLPGGRFEEGEFIFSPLLQRGPGEDPVLQDLCDPLAGGFITNFIREFGNVEYLNLGRVEPATPAGAQGRGRRGVYLAEIKARGDTSPHQLILRLQRWGIRERLEERDEHGRPKDLLRAIFETEEYVDYTLDRRLGCLQFSMRLPPRVTLRRVTEPYTGSRREFHGRRFPVIYFERDHLPGVPSDKVSDRKLADPRYAEALAGLLGKAAAPNLIVGRTLDPIRPDAAGEVLFDNGDEIVEEGADGLPRHLVLVDHSGAFADWRTASLLAFARSYAGPVNRRADRLADPKRFAETYHAALREEFARLQSDYRLRRRAFDGLFRLLPNEEGSFACRWEHVLQRLERADVAELLAAIRRHITVLA